MKKLQQHYIFSFKSKRLKKTGKINCTIEDARKNSELIALGESQLIRTIKKITNTEFNQESFNVLWNKRVSLKKKRNNIENIEKIKELSKEIDNILFIPQLISITFDHVAHYKRTGKQGVYINGKKFIRFMAGAGQLRRSTVLFCEESIRDELVKILENGIDKNIPVNFGKYGAYFGLYSSSSLPVTIPNIAIIPDLEIKRMRKVDFVEDNNIDVSEKEIEVVHNIFDGQGLISMDMAKQWSLNLELDYEAVSFIMRAPFTKGLLVAFPFHTFAKENNVTTISDIYGNIHNISEIDVILTESQFKMKSHYKSIKEFQEKCVENNLGWGVTRVNPKVEKSHFFSSYQYIQVLNHKTDIDSLTSDTIEYFNDVSLLDANKSLAYLMGEDTKKEKFDFDRLDNPMVKVLGMNSESINDPYIRNNIIKTLNKKIKESYTGKLLLNGNYQFIIFDPYALAQYALIKNIHPDKLGLLKEKYHYSQYWNNKETSKVVSGRSPLTWRSELNTLNLVDNKDTYKWFDHIYSGIIFNIHGVDMMLFGDSDGDGDSIFTTDNEDMIVGTFKNGKPVTYNKVNAPKAILDYDKFIENDINSFNSDIGLITNYSSTYYSLQSTFHANSDEYKEIENRLKICRRGQGQAIDKTKGIITGKFPEWSKRVYGNPVHNNILTDKRPFWMQYLYSHKKHDWERHVNNFDFYCYGFFECGILELLEKQVVTSEEQKVIEKFIRHSPLILNGNSVMDKVSKKMLSSVKELRLEAKNKDFKYSIYMNKSVGVNEEVKNKLFDLMKLYNKMKKDFYLNSSNENVGVIIEHIKNRAFEISSDLTELTNSAVELCYGDRKANYEFVWQIFSDGIIDNMRRKYHVFSRPVESKKGFSFMNKKYFIEEVSI